MIFFLKKLIRAFILPPGIFVVLFTVWGAVLLWRRRRSGWLPLGSAALLYLLSVGLVADPLLGLVEVSRWDPAAVRQADVIVLLGGGIVEGAPDLTGDSTPSPDMMCRLVDTVRLQRQLGAPVIVAGGAVDGGPSEAGVVRRFLQEFGVPGESILLDERSRDPVENARYSARIMREKGFRKAVLVTSGYHLRRALLLFRAAGVNCTGYPSNLLAERKKSLNFLDFLPAADEFRKSAIAWRELVGGIFYRVRYGAEPGRPEPAGR
jgi:uncharacterized SAM-binding protein YcdF (DUF218 family)